MPSPHASLDLSRLIAIALLYWAASGATAKTVATQPAVAFEQVRIEGPPAQIKLDIAATSSTNSLRPAILMIGAIDPAKLPEWSVDLVQEGYLLCAFRADYPPDPDPAKRPEWLHFDERFAHSYALGGSRAVQDTARVIDELVARHHVDRTRIGWVGSSSTGIPGLAAATQGPRLAAIVAFVSTGAYTQWFDTWHTNKLWIGKGPDLWPETRELLKKYDPILHVDHLYPTAVLMVSGGADKVVDPRTARAFMDAARPYYEKDPDRLRLVVYEGMGHNLPIDIVKLYVEHWMHLYLNRTHTSPAPTTNPSTLDESVRRTQINAADHKAITGAR